MALLSYLPVCASGDDDSQAQVDEKAAQAASMSALVEFEDAVQKVFASKRSAVVAVIVQSGTTQEKPEGETFDSPGRAVQFQPIPSRIGIGVVLTVDGQQLSVLTCAHLLEPFIERRHPSTRLSLLSSEGEISNVSVVASDPRSDLAIVTGTIEGGAPDQVPLAAGKSLKVGSVCVAIGDPLRVRDGESPKMSLTVCQSLGGRLSPVVSTDISERSIHNLGTLVDVNLGKSFQWSGTPLFSLDGELAGLVTSQSLPQQKDHRSAMVIPVGDFRGVIESLLEGYEVDYGFLGIHPGDATENLMRDLGPSIPNKTAAIINRVSPGSPAERGGLHVQDVVLQVNGQPVTSGDDLVRLVGLVGAGNQAELIVYRPNGIGILTLNMILGKWPALNSLPIVATQDRIPVWRGMKIDYPTARRSFLPDRFLSQFPRGVVVTSVEEETPAAEAGLQVGQFVVKLGGQQVETPEDFKEIVRDARGEMRLVLSDGQEIVLGEPVSPPKPVDGKE
ncbi:S1C family serine protease [Thalassoglobus neptunius]|uniref:S1C family serine protease n=1 Tax=Thalassoglobus neptunius TaxID=1938619 RepID=UPI001E57E936|nr:PDZ domain-containing protein [Thalassoglobus neptunius]